MDVTSVLNQLNSAQEQAVTSDKKHLLVLAGAGSGKTRVLVHRIAWKIQVDNVSPYGILAVTFTNKAAREMRERIDNLLGMSLRGMWVGTFHGLAHRLLKAHWRDAKLPENFQILDSDDQLRLVKRVMRAMDLDEQRWPPKQAQWWINGQKDEGLRAAHIQESGDPFMATMLRIYRQYELLCEQLGVIDFAELLLRVLELWRNNPEVLGHYQQRFGHILVDEFQDTNVVQYAWLRLLAGKNSDVTAVGDDDQSIYAWRGARPENLMQLQEDFPSLEIVKLEQNYRSTGRILGAANKLIDNNPHLIPKTLWSELGPGDPLRFITSENEDTECERVVNEIIDMRLKRRCKYSDFAVLYRGNYQAKLVEIKLQTQSIPYEITGGQSFYAKTEIKDVMAYLRLVINTDDDNALLRIINTPRRQIGPTTLERLGDYANKRGLSMYAAIDEVALSASMPANNLERLKAFKSWITGVQKNIYSGNPIAAVNEMLSDADYLGWLHQNASSDPVAQKRWDNVNFLLAQLTQALKIDQHDEPNKNGDSAIENAISK
ncbi:MAG: UvrD-helicase domain-containing protein, partial [Cellvibrionales bacterium]|nr:UvrD-helicase domain-containing protein [Cellvibrionales bacterium]